MKAICLRNSLNVSKIEEGIYAKVSSIMMLIVYGVYKRDGVS